MQYRRQGNRIQVLAYRGYDRAKRRAVVKLLGSIDSFTLEPTEKLISNLTDDEKQELQTYIEKLKQSDEKRRRLLYTETIASKINLAVEAIKAGEFAVTEAWAAQTWAAIEALAKALRKGGHPRPRRSGGKAVQAEESGQEHLPLALGSDPPQENRS